MEDTIFDMAEESAAMHELKAAAFETLLFFPGIDFMRWCQVLLKEYTEEVIDALGDDAETVMQDLQTLWNNVQYVDEPTGISRKYSEWAALLKNKAMVDKYYELVEEANKLKGIK